MQHPISSPGVGSVSRRPRGVRSTARAAPASRSSGVFVVGAAAAIALGWGWRVRGELYWSAEYGLGYALGIVGTACMLLLLVYSLRKRTRALRQWGPLRRWLNVHMALGLLGPTAILFHANFRLGSLNGNVALLCVLTVSGSGIVGRFIYPRVHHGLSGRRATLRDLQREVEARRGGLELASLGAAGAEPRVRELEALALSASGGFAHAARAFFSVGGRVRALRRSLGDPAAREAGRPGAARDVEGYLRAVRRAARFGLYERLFSLWHAFHLPLCVMLFAAAAIHVIAVHMY